MIVWLLLWLPVLDGVVTPPTPVALPFTRRDGGEFGALPTIVRRLE